MIQFGKSVAKFLMKGFPRFGDAGDLHLQEIFNHDLYQKASQEIQKELQLQSAQYTYDYEKDEIRYFQHYFPLINPAELRDKIVLDLGSFTGGRLVAWAEIYGFAEAHGIDVEEVYAEAGNHFAASKGAHAIFTTGFGENLPYADGYFDFVISYDVFEHVRDVTQVMKEVRRVLKDGGCLLTVFPPYYNPLEAHLRLATSLPALHWLFSGKSLTAAYYEVLAERGPEASWYARKSAEREHWEKSPFLNGITAARFRRIISSTGGWSTMHWGVNSLVSHGRRSRLPAFRLLSHLLNVPARLPGLEELFLGRICCALKKTN